ncbi:MAG: amino acid ABC transporter permease [Ancalomicrobiaceae bacterium]|nr:amino acid ABC transporter permease [Ancalomicrobiaceae bacterium]
MVQTPTLASPTVAGKAFVRRQLAASLPPPLATAGILGWLRKNLFGSLSDAILTVVGLAIIVYVVWTVADFAIVRAVTTATTGEACRKPGAGACWPYVTSFWRLFAYGYYPPAEQWRPNVVFALFALLLIPLAIPAAPLKRTNAVLFLIGLPIVAAILLSGGVFGLASVETRLWGGFLVTLIIAVTGIVASFPLGLLLALGRRSNMPAIRFLSVMYIEFWRGVPLITVLFLASNMLPLFLPVGWNVDQLVRALVGVTLFTAAYIAEIIRGGLQAIPRGQYEGAMALGLGYWQMMVLIVLPQAIKIVIPNLVSSFISLFKDTTLVQIVSIYDLLGTIQQSRNDPAWTAPTTSSTGYLVAALIFWTCCFGMSRYSQFIERRLHTGHRR